MTFEFSTKDGRTKATVTVQLEDGIAMRTGMQIVDKCSEYGKGIYIARDDNPDLRVDAKSIMQVVMLAATRGTKLHIEVEGDDESAETMTLMLASAFTGTDSYNLDFGRYL